MHVLIEEVALRARLVAPILTLPEGVAGMADKDDEIYVIVAVSENADAIVTGNTRHFTEPSYGNALVVSAREFLDMAGQ